MLLGPADAQQHPSGLEVDGHGELRLAVAGGIPNDRREVNDDVRIGDRGGERGLVAQVADHDLEARVRTRHGQTSPAGPQRVEYAHVVAERKEERDGDAADVSRAASYDDAHGGCSSSTVRMISRSVRRISQIGSTASSKGGSSSQNPVPCQSRGVYLSVSLSTVRRSDAGISG